MDFQVFKFLRRYPHGFRLMFNSMEEWIFKCLSSFVAIHTDSDLCLIPWKMDFQLSKFPSLDYQFSLPWFHPFFMFFTSPIIILGKYSPPIYLSLSPLLCQFCFPLPFIFFFYIPTILSSWSLFQRVQNNYLFVRWLKFFNLIKEKVPASS
jgi:hypothetical protein